LDIRCFIKEEVISNLIKTKENIMDFLKKISSWANQLVEVGTTLIALGVVFEVLFKGMNIPFWPNVSVVDNIMGIIGGLSAEGLVGLVGAFVLYHILKNKG
jgi:hypothetical protein